MRALPDSRGTRLRLDGIDVARRSHLQQLPAERQQSLTAAISQVTEEADAHKAMGKHMEKEAAQKLFCCDRHQLLFAAVSVIFPAERHLTIGEVDEPVIGDGNAMGVAGQVMKDVLRAAEWRFGVYDPVLAEERTKKRAEYRFLSKRLKTARKGQLAFPKGSLQSRRELAAKDPAEHFHGQEEYVAWMNPVLMIERKTPSRKHAMGMWVVQDVLTPRMQHAHESDLSTQMLGIGSDF